jgi:uncharacterized membrane protein
MIAAIYTVVSVCFSAITYGPVQVRISEAFTLLPVFAAGNIWGVTIGCFLTNVIGFFTGANILGSLDIIFGTLATFLAAVTTYFLRNIKIKGLPVASVFPPIIFNAVVVGWELCVLINGGFNTVVFIAQAASVAAGQLISCGVIGLIMVNIINKNTVLKELISKS